MTTATGTESCTFAAGSARDPRHELGDFAAHSLRAGFLTSGARHGIAEASLQNVMGHRWTSILRSYIR